MNKSILTPLTLAGLALAVINASAENKKSDWVALFDGKSTKGWTPRAKVESFEAKNGELQLFSKVNVWVVSDLKMADFEALLLGKASA